MNGQEQLFDQHRHGLLLGASPPASPPANPAPQACRPAHAKASTTGSAKATVAPARPSDATATPILKPATKAAWRTASSLNSRLYLVYGSVACDTLQSKYCPFQGVHQTWGRSNRPNTDGHAVHSGHSIRIIIADTQAEHTQDESSNYHQQQMTSVVLLGAGASFGSGAVVPHVPPLGNGNDGLFSQLDLAGGLASQLPDDLKAMFRSDFEKGMAEYYEYSDGNIMAFQRELAGYLAQFRPELTNTYRKLIEALGCRRVIYSSLNYDLLFELSAAALGLDTNYSIDGPAAGPRLLKLHGSCNFWPDIPLGMFHGLTVRRSGRADIQAPIRPLTQEETLHRSANDDSLAPAIAMYAEGKAVKVSPDYVEAQQAQWQSALAVARHVFVVGVRVHPADTHIWGSLAKTKASITYFGRRPNNPEFLQWKAAARKKNAFYVEATFEECVSIIRSRLR